METESRSHVRVVSQMTMLLFRRSRESYSRQKSLDCTEAISILHIFAKVCDNTIQQ